jgi:RimJ/RimL family protein N-acetyltransferase
VIVATGPRVALRPLGIADVTDTYLRWMTDPEVTQFLESRFRSVTRESLAAFVSEMEQNADSVMLAIVERDGDRHVGNIKIGPIDRPHEVADIGLLIGEKACWGRGYATEAIGLAVRYAFDRLRLRRLTAGAYANNLGSIRAFEKVGFRREGVRRQHYRCGDRYVDGVLLGLLRDEIPR